MPNGETIDSHFLIVPGVPERLFAFGRLWKDLKLPLEPDLHRIPEFSAYF